MKGLKKEFSTNKLELYLKNSNRGFVLISVNNRRYREEIFRLIDSYGATRVYDLKEIGLQDTIREIQEKDSIKRVVYYNMESSDVEKILEKINLSRDLLLKIEKLFVLVVPAYVGQVVQEKFPNLYSYVVLEESYVKRYDNAGIFEYIIPGTPYLITKESQRLSKKNFYFNKESVDERLDYYMQAKVSQEELHALIHDVNEAVGRIMDKNAKYDFRYWHALILKLAKVLAIQDEFESALMLYELIAKRTDARYSFLNLYYEALIGMGDVYLAQESLDKAIQIYNNVLAQIAENGMVSRSFTATQMHIYPRIAICHMKQGKLEEAYERLKAVMPYFQECSIEKSDMFFEVYYNYLLLGLKMHTINRHEYNDAMNSLNDRIYNVVQKAMFLTVQAWYKGVVEGNLMLAISSAQEALDIKRRYFIENDLRIAESHYVIAVLYMLSGLYEKAERCCRKCINILKNFKQKQWQNIMANTLLEEILEEQAFKEI